MARAPALFRPRDVEAFVRAVRKGGLDVARVEMVTPEGKIVAITGKPEEVATAAPPAGEPNEWDTIA